MSGVETDIRLEDQQKTPVRLVRTGHSQTNPWLIKFLAVVLVLVFSAAGFLALDWLYSARILRSAGHPTTCIVADPVRHHAFRPNCESTERWGGHSYEVFTNNLGLRDEKITRVPLTDSRPRVLFLGDSYTEALGVDWRDSYVGRIASRFPQYDFLNGGVESYAPSNYLNVTRQLLAAGVDSSVIALWLGHESVNTTQIYLHAHLALKEAALARTTPPNVRPGRFRPDDRLLAFLSSL